MALNICRLEQRIEDVMGEARVPGLALALIQGQEVIYACGFGLTGVEDGGLPVTARTLFRVGSLTKSMTATAIMRTVERGALDLDAPVSRTVPWLRFGQEGAEDRITLRMLLSHSAGLPTAYAPFGRRGQDGLEGYVRDEVSGYEFLAPPGRLYSYSNPGVRVAGLILQVVAGRPYTELMQELVFDPLDMGRTTFDPTVAMTYPVAQSHQMDDDGRLRVWHRYSDDTGSYPSGSAISTAADMAHYGLMQLNAGVYRGRRVLAAESVAEMQSAQVDCYAVEGGGYGLGFHVDSYKGQRRVWHEGSTSNFGSRLVLLTGARAGVVIMNNHAPGFWVRAAALTDSLLDELLGLPAETPEPPSAEPDRSCWPQYEGAYLGDWRGLAEVKVADGQLTLAWNGVTLPLFALRRDLYWGRKPGSEELVAVGFVPEKGGQVEYVQVNSSPCRRWAADGGLVPPPGEWPAYAGHFVGAERLRVRVEGGRLLLYSEDAGREMPCLPLGDHRFASNVGLVEFQVAEDGTVAALRFGRIYTLSRES
jgi:CubicO group peptidase (beta-lactamase class C family)